MKINNLEQEYLFIYLSSNSSFLLKLKQQGEIWLFNCFEGCQHILARKKIKISQIKKIIITDNSINNISGLLGLLSSISLNTNISRIDIYGPVGLSKYIFFGRKYSQTNFRYQLYVHTILERIVLKQLDCRIYAFMHNYNCMNYLLIMPEEKGSFNTSHAIINNIPFGPLYGSLKSGQNFILPDGFMLNSKKFICGYYLGVKILFANRNIKKYTVEIMKKSTYVCYY